MCSTDHSMEQIFLLIKVKWKYFASTFTENCKYHDIVQCNSLSLILLCAWLLWLCLLQCSGCQWMDLMRRSCERLEDNYSDLPASEWSCFSCAGLGWCIQTSPPAGQAPHTCCGQWCQLQQWSHPSNNNLPTTAVNHISRNTMFGDTCILAPSTCWK